LHKTKQHTIPSIVDLCDKGETKHKHMIWKWMTEENLLNITDIIGKDGHTRTQLLHNLPDEAISSLKQYTNKWTAENRNNDTTYTGKWVPNTWVKNKRTSQVGKITKLTNKHVHANIIKQTKRGTCSLTEENRKWKRNQCTEVAVKGTRSKTINTIKTIMGGSVQKTEYRQKKTKPQRGKNSEEQTWENNDRRHVWGYLHQTNHHKRIR
jgi:hypothetical protein